MTSRELVGLGLKQQAIEKLARARNIAEQLRITDSQEKELARKLKLLEAEKERQAIQHEMDRAKSRKEADVSNHPPPPPPKT